MMQLARILSSGIAKRLVLIHLALNQIGDQGLMALASAITSGAMPQLSMIVLQGNPGRPYYRAQGPGVSCKGTCDPQAQPKVITAEH